MSPRALGLGLLSLCLLATPAPAADWPAWRFDTNRSSASPHDLPAQLHPQWVRREPALAPAWPDQSLMPFDAAYEPVVVGHTLYFGSSRTDSVTAVDTATGEQRWRFYAEGPVRFAPLIWEGRLYVVSDDGYLYCLDADKGALLWKFRGGPGDRHILGNNRLISIWPARGAPVIADGTVYFAASIWPFMGIFIHALDARTGSVVWTNDGDGSIYMKQPHNTDSFAGVAPQGPMAVVGDKLLVTGGRSVPACYDRKTGKLIHYLLAENSKKGGGSTVAAIGRVFVNGGGAFDLNTGKHLGAFPNITVLTDEILYGYQGGMLRAYDLLAAPPPPTPKPAPEKKNDYSLKGLGSEINIVQPKWKIPELASVPLPGVTCMIKAGSRMYLGMPRKVVAVTLPLTKDAFRVEWEGEVEGTVASLVAADDRLFAVTLEGRIHCFGPDPVSPRVHHQVAALSVSMDGTTDRARAILDSTRVRDGYCVVWGVGNGRLVTELVRQSRLHVIAVDPDPAKVRAARESLIVLGLYGERAAVHLGDPRTFEFPPYLASLVVVSDDLPDFGSRIPDLGLKIFPTLRPYGGTACLPLRPGERTELIRTASQGAMPGALVKDSAAGLLLTRPGAIPGAANWTHEHADAANTRVSQDQVVKAPLGVLWFGGPSHEGILPRHGHGPQPQVIDGRLIIEGVDKLRAVDIYTGRLLWETPLPGLGAPYNNTAHQAGANAGGTNFISTADGIYVAYRTICVVLDPETGRRIGEYRLPPEPGQQPHRWGYINVDGDYLVGGISPMPDLPPEGAADEKPQRDLDPRADAATKPDEGTSKVRVTWKQFRAATDGQAMSTRLVVMDRHTGKLLWQAASRAGFRHNGICIGGGRLYAVDRPRTTLIGKPKPDTTGGRPRLVAYDLKTGSPVWADDDNVFGTYLSYSARHDVLVETGRVARDTLPDEPKGMRAYRGDTGQVLWEDRTLVGPAMLHGDIIIRDKGATDLLTGAPWKKPDPLTGEPVEWTWARNYGCNTPSCAQHLMTFRSGAAGYCDLDSDAGTGNFGGIRSGCTNNLVVAGGIISSPDYTRTCTCSYQNQTSLALVPMADAEMWTSSGKRNWFGPVRRLGLNFGAPGDRRADDGTLWLEYPSVGGNSPVVQVKVGGAGIDYFRRHSSAVQGGVPWIAASGVKGLDRVTITLGPSYERQRPYTVRLHFAEPESAQPGERVFDVMLQGKKALEDLDIAKETGGSYRGLIKEVRGVLVTGELEVRFAQAPGSQRRPLICGIEVVAEGW